MFATTLVFGLVSVANAADAIAVPERRVVASGQHAHGRGSCIAEKPCYAFVLTPSLPITLTRLDVAPSGATWIGRDFMLGLGATFEVARGTLRTDDADSGRHYAIDDASSEFTFGAAVQAGTTEIEPGHVVGSATLSTFVGTHWLALSAGYDLSTREPFLGLTVNVIGTTIDTHAAAILGMWR